MKKKKWIMLLALALAALLPGTALAAAGDANIARNSEMQEKFQDGAYGACVCGDTLYFYGSQHIYTYHIGDADLTAAEFELPAGGQDESRNIQRLFSDGETLYAFCTLEYYGEDGYGTRAAEIYPVEIEGEKVVFGEPTEINIDGLTVSYGGDSAYFMQVNDTCYVGGYLMMYAYNDSDREVVYALDIESGEGYFIDGVERVRGISNYADDQLLIEYYDYESGSRGFQLYDPESDSLTSACEMVESNGWLGGMVYSEESGRLFYMDGGYIKAAKDFDFENAEEVAELSTLYYSDTGGMLLPGDYYVFFTYDNTFIRATDPDALPETRLVVQMGGSYSDSIMTAYYSFGNTHGDVAVVLDQTYSEASKVIEAMMGRDSSVDIYMMSASGEAFDALYNRGFLVELKNEEIVSEVNGMYPAVQSVLTRDGEVVAVPVSVYAWMPGLDYEGFEKIGIAREDVPDNWMDLLDLLPELPDLLPESGNIRIFEDYMTQKTAGMQLVSAIMESWRIHQSATGQAPSYDDPVLIELFEKALALDFEELGLREGDDEEEIYRSYAYAMSDDERNYTLFETSVGCTIGNFYSNCEPALLGVAPGETGEIPLGVTVAIVNPFSEHVELAEEFLVELLRNMENRTAYNLSDRLNEPVMSKYTQESLDEYQKMLTEAQEKLEVAEPVDKPAIEEEIRDIERVIEDLNRYGWDISAKDIEWYRAHEDAIAVERYDFLSAAGDDGELSDLYEQFMAGKVSPADFLKEIDRKVRMRAMEGN